MAIHEIAPSGDLARDVDGYWWRDDSPAPGSVRVLPDGCADIVFHREGGAFIVGTMTRPLTVNGADSAGLFGVRFRPAAPRMSFVRRSRCSRTRAWPWEM